MIHLERFYFVIFAIMPFVGSFACVFGVVTNVINVTVFYRQGILADNCTPCLVALAVTDFCVCLISAPINAMNGLVYVRVVTDAFSYYRVLMYLFREVNKILCNTSCCITLFLASERMASVTFPFQVKTLLTPKRSCVALLIIMTFSIALYLPLIVPLYIEDHGNSWHDLRKRDYLTMTDVAFERLQFANMVVLRGVCIFGVVTFNIIIVVKVYVSSKFRQRISVKNKAPNSDVDGHDTKTNDEKGHTASSGRNQNKKEMKLVRMMVIICSMFAVLYSPTAILLIVIEILKGRVYDVTLTVVGICLVKLIPYLEVINSSSNFLIYVSMSSKFKKELRHLFGCSKGKSK